MFRCVRQHIAEWRQLMRWRILQCKAAKYTSALTAERPPSLMLFPCDFGSVIGSRGDEAMIYAILSDFRNRHPEGRIVVVTTSSSFPDSSDGRRLRADFSPSLVVHPTPGGLKNFFKLLLAERPTEVYALGADCMDGHYSPFTSVNLLGVCDLAIRLGIPSILTSFSWNDHPHTAIVRAFRFATARLPILVRDPVSFTRFTKGVSRAQGARTELVADVAFNLQPKSSVAVRTELDWMSAEKRRGRFVLGFNLHAMLVPAAELPDFIVRVAHALDVFLAAHPNVSLVFIPHDYRDGGDLAVLKQLRAAIKAQNVRIPVADHFFSAAELKALTRGLDALFSSRMHLAIAALGQGKPVAGFAYQGKFAGLFRHFDLPETLILSPGNVTDLPHVLTDLVIGTQALATVVSDRLAHVLELARRNLISSL